MTVSIWQANESDRKQIRREVDFLIIGAGLVGTAAAYFATQAGKSVVLTETRSLGMGASSRNAGFMITGLDMYYHKAIHEYGQDRARDLWSLSQQTHDHWQFFIDHARAQGTTVRLDRCGSMLLAESPEEARELELAANALHADGIDCLFHPSDPLGRGYFAAIEQPHDCAVQPYELVLATLAASGSEVVSDNEVYKIEQPDGERVIVSTRQVIFEARHVLLCTNAYSASIHPYFIDKVIPTRAQCLVTAPLPQAPFMTCGYSDYGYMYYRSTFDNRLLIGGGRKDHQAIENNTTDDRISAPVQAVLDNYLRMYFPEVTVPVERRWAGIMGFSIDGVPLVGTLPGMPRVGFAVGFTGHGLSFGAGTAERAVDHLLNGVSAGAVDVARFH